jgi:hypothetical protein
MPGGSSCSTSRRPSSHLLPGRPARDAPRTPELQKKIAGRAPDHDPLPPLDSGISVAGFAGRHRVPRYVVPYFFVFPIAFALNRLGQHYDIDPADTAKWATFVRGSRFWNVVYLCSNLHLEHHYFPNRSVLQPAAAPAPAAPVLREAGDEGHGLRRTVLGLHRAQSGALIRTGTRNRAASRSLRPICSAQPTRTGKGEPEGSPFSNSIDRQTSTGWRGSTSPFFWSPSLLRRERGSR